MAKKVQIKQLVLERPFRQWLAEALNVQGLLMDELTVTILVESCELPEPFHGDPADQIIAASARHHIGRLITKDGKLRDYAHLSTIW